MANTMTSFEFTEHFEHSPEDVFDFMMDFANAPYWRSLVKRMEVVGGGVPRAGGELLVTFEVGGHERQIITHVSEVERPRVFSFWNETEGFRGDFTYTLHREGSGTRVVFTGRATPSEPWRWVYQWFMLPLVFRQTRERYSPQLSNLRAAMEKRSAAAQ